MTAVSMVVPARRSATAVTLLMLAIAAAGAALALLMLTLDVPVEAFGFRGFQGPLGVLYAVLGWLIVTRAQRNPIGWIFLISGLLSSVQGLSSSYGVWSVAEHGRALPGTDLAIWLCTWLWVPLIGSLVTFVPLLFPSGRFENRAQFRLGLVATLAVTGFTASMALMPGQASEMPPGVENPYPLPLAQHDVLMSVVGPFFLLTVALCVATLVRRFRRSRGEVRQQLKWLSFAALVSLVSLLCATPLLLFGDLLPSDPAVRIIGVVLVLGFAGIPIATGLAILRHGLYDIDVVINKTVTYGLLAALITVLSLGIVLGIGSIVGSQQSTGLAVAATAVVALAVQPLRARAHHVANRIVYGKRSTPYEALSAVSSRLAQQAGDPLPELARLMTEATAANRAAVWLAVDDGLRPVASFPVGQHLSAAPIDTDLPPGADRAYPVTHEGERLGMLTVVLPPNDTLTGTEERLLSDLASHAGLLLRNARLIEELRASRQRIVAAGDAERRKIERNIHDGAQQRLVALKVQLRLAQRTAGDPDTVASLLEHLGADVQETIEELRALSHGIFPPVLVDRGLVAALESAASRAALPVTFHGDGVDRYPAEIESAVYFCCLEALQNAGKYAGEGATAKVLVRADASFLEFEVRDDGQGFDPESRGRGIGFQNMHDRIGAIGGSLTVVSSIGAGVAIRGRVPVSSGDGA